LQQNNNQFKVILLIPYFYLHLIENMANYIHII